MRKFIIAVALLALAIPGTAHAESGFKVTGGGQAFAGEAGQGPGDTFGFNAQDTDGDEGDAAKGNLNHIDRSPAEGSEEGARNQGKGVHYKGDVTCLQALGAPGGSDGAARFGGELRNAVDGPVYFSVDVTDNGEGNAPDDLIIFRTFTREDMEDDDESPCDYDPEDEEDQFQMARGNVQVHNYDSANSGEGGSADAARSTAALLTR